MQPGCKPPCLPTAGAACVLTCRGHPVPVCGVVPGQCVPADILAWSVSSSRQAGSAVHVGHSAAGDGTFKSTHMLGHRETTAQVSLYKALIAAEEVERNTSGGIYTSTGQLPCNSLHCPQAVCLRAACVSPYAVAIF